MHVAQQYVVLDDGHRAQQYLCILEGGALQTCTLQLQHFRAGPRCRQNHAIQHSDVKDRAPHLPALQTHSFLLSTMIRNVGDGESLHASPAI